MTNKDIHEQFVKFMVKKANTKEKEPEAFTILNPSGKDSETEKHDHSIQEGDVKKAEKHVEKYKKSIK